MMAFAALAEATQGVPDKHAAYVKAATGLADYAMQSQWRRDVNYGYCACGNGLSPRRRLTRPLLPSDRHKARWKGGEMPTTGSYSAIAGRPDVALGASMAFSLAYKTSSDAVYKKSLEQFWVWLQRTQFDDIDDPRCFGGAMQGLQVLDDELNGFGCNFGTGNAGHGVGLMLWMMDQGLK